MDIQQHVSSTITSGRLAGQKSTLQRGGMAGTTILTSLVLTACATPATDSAFTLVDGVYTGTSGANTLAKSADTAGLVVNGFAGIDTITTGTGADVVRAGTGADNVSTGDGDDTIVVIGTTTANEYASGDIPSILDKVVTLATLNGQSTSEAASGEILNAGDGADTLHLYGTLDMSSVTLTGIENITMHSDVILSTLQLASLTITGDGGSTLRVVASGETSASINLGSLNITGINQLSVGS
ncbi:MAG: hypothetical protein NZ738_05800, partial [Oceanospirillaceae bacterium]|nr:hypothetical protein [Oceanospirillaceae bacterium]